MKKDDCLSWNIYQIYPRSFCDTNGDGVGDLQGIISKLDYLAELGINAVWICPCFKSPNVDNGYDVADYRDIMDEFGTLEDMRQLIDELHKRDMKLILDLVPNHTSDQHYWFQESRKSKDNPYSDYYYWYDTPPNDWESSFGGSAWQYDEQRKQYYLHSYAVEQPDLNWENPKVIQEMQSVVDFWIDMGADGFRVDVIDQISKDFKDNHNCFGPHLHEYIRALFGREKTAHLFTVGECWADGLEEIRRHIGHDRGELSTLFQFEHLGFGRRDKFTSVPGKLTQLWDYLRYWAEVMQNEDLLFSLFSDNHDNGWMLERLGSREKRYESATCIATMLYLMRGVCFVYQGQELGMMNPSYDSIADFRDVESLNIFKEFCTEMSPEQALEKINFGSRDNQRHPFCWSDDKNAGFTVGTPWIPVHSAYKEQNLKTDLSSKKSIWQFYRDIFQLRNNHSALTVGKITPVAPQNSSYGAYTRTDGNEQFLVVCNFETAQELVLPELKGELLLSNYGHCEKKDHYFEAYEIAVFRKEIDT